jgi:hypothetical protein
MKPPVHTEREQNKPVRTHGLTDELFPVDEEQKRPKKEGLRLYSHNQQNQTDIGLCKKAIKLKRNTQDLEGNIATQNPTYITVW